MSAEQIARLKACVDHLADAIREATERNGGDVAAVGRNVAALMQRAVDDCRPAELAEKIDAFHVWSADKIAELQQARAADEAEGLPLAGSRLEALAPRVDAELRERTAEIMADIDQAGAAAWQKAVQDLEQLLAHVAAVEGLSHGTA